MKYLLNTEKFFEGVDSVDPGLLVVQCLGFLTYKPDPQDELFYKDVTNKRNLENFHKNEQLNQESIAVFKGILKGVEPDQVQKNKIQPILNYISFLNDRSKTDAFVNEELKEFVRRCEKNLGIKVPPPQKSGVGAFIKKTFKIGQ